jgi:aspartate racemase
MKTIGLLGGMSWESSVLYYQTINRTVRDAGQDRLRSAPIILDSVDFAPMAQWQREGNWAMAADFLAARAKMLEAAGAQVLGLCTNTMHKVFERIAAQVSIPMIHIATPTIAALQAAGVQRAAFFGTQFSMSERFLADAYAQAGIELLMPAPLQQNEVHRIIMSELCQGVVRDESRAAYVQILADLQSQGAQAVVLGCTEITLLVHAQHIDAPLFDTADLHAKALAHACLS